MVENSDILWRNLFGGIQIADALKIKLKLCCFTDLILLHLCCQGYNGKLLSFHNLPEAYSLEFHGQNKN